MSTTEKVIEIPASILKAENMTYDNTNSGLEAENAQEAIDALNEELKNGASSEALKEHIESTNNPHKVTAEQVGLGNVPNVSTNDQTPTFTPAATLETLTPGEKISALFGKIAKAIIDLISHIGNKSNPHGVTKDQIGLGNVDNTADNSKPVSTSQQDAIDAAYYNANQYTDQKIAELINGAPSTLDTLKEIADAMAESEDVVAALDAAIGTKASQSELDSHLASKSNPHGVTKSQVGLGSVPNVTTNDQTPTYTEATTLATLNSGEKLSVAFGKIAKAVNDFINHLSASNPHNITSVSGNAGTATKLATARNIDGVSFDGSADIVHYAICETAADVAEKIIDIPNFVLKKGSTIQVRFENGNTAQSPTLNVNGTGAAAIYYTYEDDSGNIGFSSAIKISAPIKKGHIYHFVYDGSSKYYKWLMVNPLNTENYKTSFTSNDTADPTAWTNVDVLYSTESHRSIFAKISTMFSNIRYIWKLIGTTDISNVADGTVTGAIKDNRGGLNGISGLLLEQIIGSLPLFGFGGDYENGNTISCQINIDVPYILYITGELDGKFYKKYYYILIDDVDNNGGIVELVYDNTPVGVDFKHNVVADWDNEDMSITFLSTMDDVQYAALYEMDFSAQFRGTSSGYSYTERNGFGTLSLCGATVKDLANWYSTVKYKLGNNYVYASVIIDLTAGDICYPGVVYFNSSGIGVDYIDNMGGAFNGTELSDTTAQIYGSVTFPLF